MNPANTVRARSYPRFLYVVYYIIIGLVRLVTRLLLAVRVTGGADFPRTGPVLIAANHLSYFDIPFLLIFLPRPPIFVAKQEVTAFPLVGRLLHRLGTVSIRRGQSDRRAIRHSLAVLENDDVLLIFPEGTRSRRPGLLAGLPGVGLLARRAGVPLVTAAITGTEKLTLRSFFRCGLTLTIGSPATLETLTPNGRRATAGEITEALMQQLAALMPPQYRGHYSDAEHAQASAGVLARPGQD